MKLIQVLDALIATNKKFTTNEPDTVTIYGCWFYVRPGGPGPVPGYGG
jgi:hypothetical protein